MRLAPGSTRISRSSARCVSPVFSRTTVAFEWFPALIRTRENSASSVPEEERLRKIGSLSSVLGAIASTAPVFVNSRTRLTIASSVSVRDEISSKLRVTPVGRADFAASELRSTGLAVN